MRIDTASVVAVASVVALGIGVPVAILAAPAAVPTIIVASFAGLAGSLWLGELSD